LIMADRGGMAETLSPAHLCASPSDSQRKLNVPRIALAAAGLKDDPAGTVSAIT
jgi:hypothetical protein